MRTKLKNRLTVILILLCFLVVSAISVTIIFALTQQKIETEVGVEYYPSLNLNAFTFTENKDGTYYITDFDDSNFDNSKTLYIPKTYNGKPVTSIGDSAFYGCNGLTSVTIPNSVTSIGHTAFYNCTGLTSVTIPDSVTSIGDSAFSYCTGLTSITIPNSVTSIGAYAFYNCYDLTSVIIPNSVTSIGDSAFSGCSGLTSITIPNSVTNISDSAFSGCSGLTSITIPDSVTSIGDSAFRWCTALTSIVIPDSVTSIGDFAFSGCTNLFSVAIEEGVTSIGYGAFFDSGLIIVIFKNTNGWFVATDSSATSGTYLSATDLADESTAAAYLESTYCEYYWKKTVVDLSLITFTESNNSYSITDCALNAVGDFIIPETYKGKPITSISDSAFSGCSGLTSITIPDSVTSIGDFAFSGCTNLFSVTIGEGVTSIGYSAFSNSGLIIVTFKNPNGWFVSSSSTATSGTYLSATDLSDASTAAYLKSTYCYKYWKRVI